jgi:hypothetical protein
VIRVQPDRDLCHHRFDERRRFPIDLEVGAEVDGGNACGNAGQALAVGYMSAGV